MKKLLAFLVVICWLIVGIACPALAELSEVKTGDSLITSGSGYFLGVMFVTDATNAVTVNIYDGTSAIGKKLIPTDTVITTAAANRIQAIGFAKGDVPFRNGIYVDVTCAGTVSYIVYYSK